MLEIKREGGVLNDELGEQPIVVMSGPRPEQITMSAFSRKLDNQVLTFEACGKHVRDSQTGSLWNIEGKAVEGTWCKVTICYEIHQEVKIRSTKSSNSKQIQMIQSQNSKHFKCQQKATVILTSIARKDPSAIAQKQSLSYQNPHSLNNIISTNLNYKHALTCIPQIQLILNLAGN